MGRRITRHKPRLPQTWTNLIFHGSHWVFAVDAKGRHWWSPPTLIAIEILQHWPADKVRRFRNPGCKKHIYWCYAAPYPDLHVPTLCFLAMRMAGSDWCRGADYAGMLALPEDQLRAECAVRLLGREDA